MEEIFKKIPTSISYNLLYLEFLKYSGGWFLVPLKIEANKNIILFNI